MVFQVLGGLSLASSVGLGVSFEGKGGEGGQRWQKREEVLKPTTNGQCRLKEKESTQLNKKKAPRALKPTHNHPHAVAPSRRHLKGLRDRSKPW